MRNHYFCLRHTDRSTLLGEESVGLELQIGSNFTSRRIGFGCVQVHLVEIELFLFAALEQVNFNRVVPVQKMKALDISLIMNWLGCY